MWPNLVDMTRDESTRVLRRLELEAYSTIVDVFRAQGFLSKDKKHLLEELQTILSISVERHRAEVRRAVNDEHLTTIADYLVGPNNENEWIHEGRRLVPLMPRLVPQTQFTTMANHVSETTAERNMTLPPPAQTGVIKEVSMVTAQMSTQTPPSAVKTNHVTSPSNVVVLPSGKSIHIKGGVNTEDDAPMKKRRRRNTSGDLSQIHVTMRPLVSPTGPCVSYATASTNTTYSAASPMKITITKTSVTKTLTTSVSGQPQKVILVSSAGQLTTSSTIHRSFPVVKTVSSSSVNTTYVTRTPAQAIAANQNRPLSHVISTSTGPHGSWASGASGNTVYTNPAVSGPRPRAKTIIRHRAPQIMNQPGQLKPGMLMSMGHQPVTPSAPATHSIQMRPVVSIPGQHLAPESGIKIISQGLGKLSATSRIIPRTQLHSTTSSGSIVVVSGSNQSSTTVTSIPRPVTATAQSTGLGSKILSITNQGGKVIATSSKGSNVVTVNPKTLHLTAVKSGTGSKPNVIVVQKAGMKVTSVSAATTTVITKHSGLPSSAFEKELVSFIQKQEPRGVIVTTTVQSDASGKPLIDAVQPVVQIQRSGTDQLGSKNTSLLAELIQAAALDSGRSSTTQQSAGQQSAGQQTAAQHGNVERKTVYAHPHTDDKASRPVKRGTYARGAYSSLSEDAVAIRALVDMHNQGKDTTSPATEGESAADSLYNLEETLKVITAQVQQRNTQNAQPSVTKQITSLASKQPAPIQRDFVISHDSKPPPSQTAPLKVAPAKNVDLLRESLASAQIDLDPYEFMDDAESRSFADKGETAETKVGDRVTMSPTDELTADTQLYVQPPNAAAAVAVVRADVDTSVMNLEDFSSQRLDTSPDFCDAITTSGDHVADLNATLMRDVHEGNLNYQSSTDDAMDASDSPTHRLSKRKRKPPTLFDNEFSETSSWVRPALSLLNRVCHFRGLNRDKDALDAAHWFLHPVDASIAPDYDKIVKNPMDLNRIKRKLEMNMYGSPDDFHSDMLLIYRNCLLYNPPGHSARQDCEELFGFYVDEYTRLIAKLSKPSVTSPSHKRTKIDRSPTKS